MLKRLFLYGLTCLFFLGFVTNPVLALNVVTNQYFSELANEPERFVGAWAKLSGQIENKQVYEEVTGYVFKIGGAESSQNEAWVQVDNTSESFSIDDCLILEGYIKGSVELENIYDHTFTVPYFDVKTYTKIDCIEGLYPTIAENNIPQTQQVGEVKITLEKVQLSKEHTRLLFNIDNLSQEVFMLGFNEILVQDRNQFSYDFIVEEYDELKGHIPSDTVEKGWLIFEPIEPKSFEVHLKPFSMSTITFYIDSLNKLDNPTPELDPEPTPEPASTCGQGTELVDGTCQVIKTEEQGGGCLIATATYGTELSPQVQLLREIRDNNLLNTESGTAFMKTFNEFYYSFSPTIADYERENPVFKEMIKIAITPMITSLSLMENANSESEVLGIGISLIILNLGMYIGIPAVVIVGIRKRF